MTVTEVDEPTQAKTACKRTSLLPFLLRASVLTVCLAVLWHLLDTRAFLDAMRCVPLWVIPLAVLVSLFRSCLSSARWQILNADPGRQLTTWQCFRYTMIGKTFNLLMPGALGGDIVRSMLVLRAVNTGRGMNLLVIVADRLVGLASIVILGFVACISAPVFPQRAKYLEILTLIGGAVVVLLLLASSRRGNTLLRATFGLLGSRATGPSVLLDNWQELIKYYRSRPYRVAMAVILCFPIHLSWFVIVYLIAGAVAIDVSFLSICTVTSIVWMITAVPLSPTGLGVRELSFVYLLSLQGVSPNAAAALSLFSFFLQVVVGLVGLPFILFGRRMVRPAASAAARGAEG